MRCPNGTRKNKKTGNCEPNTTKPEPKVTKTKAPKVTKTKAPKVTTAKAPKKTAKVTSPPKHISPPKAPERKIIPKWTIHAISCVVPTFNYDDNYKPDHLNYPIDVDTIQLMLDKKLAILSMNDGTVLVGDIVNGNVNTFKNPVEYKSLIKANIKVANVPDIKDIKWSVIENDEDGNYSTSENFEMMGENGKTVRIKVNKGQIIQTEDDLTDSMKTQIAHFLQIYFH